MAAEKVRYELQDNIAVIALDDGKVNALSHEVISALHACLDRAEREAAAVVIVGRDKRFSGGFDLATMTRNLEDMRGLVIAGAELLMRIYLFPRPVVAACTGHALAAGALLLLACDTRIGAQGDFKLGLNEVSLQMTLPIFALELARDRLSKRHFSAAVTQAKIFDPEGARDAGYLDGLAAPEKVLETAVDAARRLAPIPDPAFRNTKRREREATVRMIRDTLGEDIAQLTGPA